MIQTATMPERDDLEPSPWYRYMREHYPVYYNATLWRWEVFRYEDVLRVLNTPSVFSSNIAAVMPTRTAFMASVIFTDPPRHHPVRALVAQAFSPKQLGALEPRIRAIVDGLLDGVVQSGKMDVVSDFAYPLPMIVIAEMLGIPPEDRADFKRWSAAFAAEQNTQLLPDVPEMDDYFRTVIRQRATRPEDDLISLLVHAQVEGDSLSEEEILGFSQLLLAAGYETTAHLLTNAFRTFDEYPLVQEQLWADPTLLPLTIEELLRCRAPVGTQFRVAAVDTVLGEQEIKAGQIVWPWLGSANRDERQFPDPDTFDMRRSPNKHVAFGLGGIHFCLGAPLARLEAKIALSRVMQRVTKLERVRSVPLEPISSFVSGVKTLPMTFEPV